MMSDEQKKKLRPTITTVRFADTIGRILEALEPLTQEQRQRVLRAVGEIIGTEESR